MRSIRSFRPYSKSAALSILVLMLAMTPGISQDQDARQLLAEIRQVDTELFAAFNRCDLERMSDIFARDLEFFHDLAGVSDYEQTLAATKTNCDRKLGLERKLVPESLEVYPVGGGYGAIQKGAHTFCHPESGEEVCGTFEFLHIWRRDEDRWRLARVVSYGH